jgi:hypothetical protein
MPVRHRRAIPGAPCERCGLPAGSHGPCEGEPLKRGRKATGPNPEVRFTPTREVRSHLDQLRASPEETDADVCRRSLAAGVRQLPSR